MDRIARHGGYPVSMAVIGRTRDSAIVHEVALDNTDVNAVTNRVVAAINVTGS